MSTPDPQPVDEPVEEWPLGVILGGFVSPALQDRVDQWRAAVHRTMPEMPTRAEQIKAICDAFDAHLGDLPSNVVHLRTADNSMAYETAADARRDLLPPGPVGFVRDGGHLGRALGRTRGFRDEATVASPTITDLLGEEPSGYRDGGYIDRLTRLDAILGARQRVQAYVEACDALLGAEALDEDVIDHADGGSGSEPLLMSDLRLLAGVEPPEIEEYDHVRE